MSPMRNGIRVASYGIVYVLGIVTVVAGISAVYPWVTISKLRTTEPGDPFAVRLVLKNEAFLPIRNLRAKCVVFSMGSPGSRRMAESAFEDLEDVKHVLKPKHQTSLMCAPVVAHRHKVSKAALAVSVSFEPYYLPWAWRREEPPFVYSLQRGEDNQIIWLPEG